jgi:hypothetical protein
MTVTDTQTAAEREVAAKIASRREAERKFDSLLTRAHQVLGEAYQIAVARELGDICVEQAFAAMRLCGVDLHTLPLSPEPDDFRELADDLVAIADAIDPLISAIGEEAKYKAVPGTITTKDHEYYFASVIKDSIEGSALCMIEQCAEAAEEEMMEAAE